MQNLTYENESFCTRIKNHFYFNGFALSFALKQRFEATSWKRPVHQFSKLKFVRIVVARENISIVIKQFLPEKVHYLKMKAACTKLF